MDINIGGYTVGDGFPSLIVAEIGENHMVDVEVAKSLIHQASSAGAGAVKFQTAAPDELYNSADPEYLECAAAELALEDYAQLMEAAKKEKLIFFSTPFDEPSADFLDELGVQLFKIGSGELTHHRLLAHVARKGKPMIVSTGMANIELIKAAAQVIHREGNSQVIFTHCVSIYPAPIELSNINAIKYLRQNLGCLVGWSDHTLSTAPSMAAIALGACYIEKHITLSRALPGGDNDMSFEPDEFKTLVHNIRDVELSLGVADREILEEEKELLQLARRGVYARRKILAGEKISPSMIAVRRPLSAISADQVDIVLSSSSRVDVEKDSPVTWDHLINE